MHAQITLSGSAGHTNRPKQGHQQGAFGIALPYAVGLYRGGWQVIGDVVAKRNSIAHKIVDGTNAFVFWQLDPASACNEVRNSTESASQRDLVAHLHMTIARSESLGE